MGRLICVLYRVKLSVRDSSFSGRVNGWIGSLSYNKVSNCSASPRYLTGKLLSCRGLRLRLSPRWVCPATTVTSSPEISGRNCPVGPVSEEPGTHITTKYVDGL
ncbi:hypothetical protein VTK56DRAFT_3751 [Thermocarpiscus australiensis]